ncbi:NAD(P)(+)--arginine ADP-ribosyltransferase 2 [Danio aesculapii]|uniref:NAD(P)(+)--arginine ADP-ribosyltransferase 2 n=1 Tax=Danio aesculapii TaxID=1142201 RepID=UPI0024C057D9|nr:NAD(P)(+)--arginine ADP-ribosyltransferase 2 [Danio aesculapii]
MLLIIEALLILSALEQDYRVAAADLILPLDMASNSVDDQYKGCRDKMANLVKTEYLKKEMSNSEEFRTAWKKGEAFVKDQVDSLTRNNLIAIYVYSDAGIYRDFNSDTRCDKIKYKQRKYKWYSLHFLLTEAIQILKKTQKKCFSTFRGTNSEFNKNGLNKKVRFGSFVSSSLDRKIASFFGKVSCFEIRTCKGAEVTEYSKLQHEREVLIPPYEVFKVTAVKIREVQIDLWCETVFTLKPSGKKSDLDCALFKKSNKTVAKYNVIH